MADANKFPLVRRPSSAVEKAAPSARRILSGMVADALMLAKKKSAPRIVVIYDHTGVLEWITVVIKGSFKDATIFTFDDSEKAWQELSKIDPDLLITDYRMPRLSGKEILQRLLDRKATYPIIVTSAFMRTEWLAWVRESTSRGLNVITYLEHPLDIESFVSALETALKIPCDAASRDKTLSLKSVKLVFSVAICGYTGGLDEHLASYLQKELTGNCTVQSNCFADSEELLIVPHQKSFDLFFIFLNPDLPSKNGQADVQKFIADLKAKYHRPIIIISNEVEFPRQMSSSLLEAGADAFFPMPFDWEHLGLALTACGIISSPNESPALLLKIPKPRGKLLILDDEEGPRQSLRVIFEDEYDLFMAEDGPTAIKLAQENEIDVAVLNIRMAYMSGIEVLERLKFLNPDIEVIMMTGFETNDTIHESLRLGACDYINKPFDIETIRTAVSKAMQHHKLKSEKTIALKKSNSNMEEVADLRLSKRRGKLLIVDDDDGPRQSLRVIFEDEYDLFMAEDGPTAIKLAQENDIDVVVTDIRLTGMSGIEVLEQVKSMKPDIEVIMMTPFWTTETLLQALRLRASDYIYSPFDLATMRAAVSKAMRITRMQAK
jgi:DNA-binding NtrC family response regulator